MLLTRLLILLLVGGSLTACGVDQARKPSPAPVILISIDTLRWDRLGCAGYERPTSPHLDRTLCRDGAVFETAVAHAPSTLASHASMLTGLLPAQHAGSFGNKRAVLPSVTTLAEALSAAGYRTASFNDGGQLRGTWGLNQGFETYRSFQDNSLATVMAPALEWLEENLQDAEDGAHDKLFLFLHTYQTHHPYIPSKEDLEVIGAAPYDGPLGPTISVRELRRINQNSIPIGDADKRFISDAYDAEIRSMDRSLGEFFTALRDLGLYERSLIIFTSDHGEEFGEHGWYGWHSHTLYDELLRVPLLVKLPGNAHAGQRIPRQVRLTDIFPTVLDAVGLETLGALDGSSLIPLLQGDPESGRRWVVSQRDGTESSSIRSREWKLIDDRLYDLASDPAETWSVAIDHEEVEEALRQRREQILGEAAKGQEVELSPEEVEQLKALGYL